MNTSTRRDKWVAVAIEEKLTERGTIWTEEFRTVGNIIAVPLVPANLLEPEKSCLTPIKKWLYEPSIRLIQI